MMVSDERIKTNLLLMDYLDYWDELTVKAINDEWTLRYYNTLMNLLNRQVDEAIEWLDTDDAKELFAAEAKYQSELFKALEDQWDKILESKYNNVEDLLQEVYNRGKAKGYTEMREHIRFTDTDKKALKFVRDYNFDLIQSLDDDTREQIKNTITSAVLSGENPRKTAPKIKDTLTTRLEGSTFTPTQRAVMIARTEISRAQNTGILQSYVNEGYTEVKILTAEDSNVCYTCLTYAYDFNENSPVIYENHREEKIHNIKELIKGGMFPPFHPNCRCTYLSVWESKGKPPKEQSLVKLITQSAYDKLKESKYIKQIRKKTSTRATPDEVAKKYNMDYYVDDDGNHIFYDKENKTKIVIDKWYIENKSFRNNFIDFTNSGKSRYDLEEIMMIYSNSPKIYKQAPNEIVFMKQPKGINYKTTPGETLGFVDKYLVNKIMIYPEAFKTNKLYRGNFAQTLYHEMGHCINNRMVNIKRLHAIRNPSQYSEEELRKIFNEGPLYILSEGIKFSISREEDRIFQRENHFPIEESSWYGNENESESMAELLSMFAFDGLEDKTMAVMQTKSGEMISFEEWKKRNPNKYKFISEEMKKIEEIGFNLKS